MSYTQVVPRVCLICGRLPCSCPKGKCSICGVTLNLDAIGESLAAWNLKHQSVTGCNGFVLDPRIKGFDMTPKEYGIKIKEIEKDSERKDEAINLLNSQIEELKKEMKK